MPDLAPPLKAPMPEPEIHVIPEKYYGAALNARVEKTVPPPPQAPVASAIPPVPPPPGAQPIIQPPPHSKTGAYIGLALAVIILGAGGAFVYFNQALLFPKPPQPVVQTPPPPQPPQPPAAPSSADATSTNPQSVALSWVDTATDEDGFRIERAEASGTFQALTNLPANSNSFLDTSVQSGTAYRYRVIALNQGGESAPSPEASASVPAAPPPAPVQPKLPPAGLDSDSDGLTDLEEALFTTNPQVPDTDGDGFLDGNEVFHLYNPAGKAPGKLLDAQLVKQTSGSVGWSMLIPTSWVMTENGDGTSATITTGHGEVFKLSIENNPKQRSILDWYLAGHPDVQPNQVLEYRSKMGYKGIIGADLLTTYIPWGDRVFVFTYSLADQPFINFRTTYSMMLNSLELKGLPQITTSTSAEPLPFEPAATTTGVVTQPVPVEATTSAPVTVASDTSTATEAPAKSTSTP